MKKWIILSASAFIASCSSDDSNRQAELPNAPNLSGKWELVSKKDHNNDLQAISDCEDNYNYYLFGSDTGAIVGASELYQVGATYYCRQATIEGNYSVSNDTLTYTWSASSYKTKYKVIGANSLTIQIQMIQYESSTGIHDIPLNQRITEICNKTE